MADLVTEAPAQKVLKELQYSTSVAGDSFVVRLTSVSRQHERSMGKIRVRRIEAAPASFEFPDRSKVFTSLAQVEGDDQWYDIAITIQMGPDIAYQPARITLDPRMARRLSVA